MFRFEKLEVWKEATLYAKKVYKTTEQFPREELFGLTSQLKRASLSIPSNIAEGSGSESIKEFCHSLDIAIKSALETVSQLLFAEQMNYIRGQVVKELYQEAETLVKRIQSLKKYLKKPRATTHVPYAKI